MGSAIIRRGTRAMRRARSEIARDPHICGTMSNYADGATRLAPISGIPSRPKLSTREVSSGSAPS
eukprot:8254044-Pyramimonas_sp.AAC.1